VTPDDALALLRPAITTSGGVWADLGAGEGTFTRALAELLGQEARIYAVDRDPNAVEVLKRWALTARCTVVPVLGDFSGAFDLPDARPLDGLLLANSLHYVRDAAGVLARLVAFLKPGGRVVLAEYDRRQANRWVPYPIPIATFSTLATAASLSTPTVVSRRPSISQGELYVAVAELAGGTPRASG
jgi:ubiquinone/menaquinone biosynthesis C-methylase UbiE